MSVSHVNYDRPNQTVTFLHTDDHGFSAGVRITRPELLTLLAATRPNPLAAVHCVSCRSEMDQQQAQCCYLTAANHPQPPAEDYEPNAATWRREAERQQLRNAQTCGLAVLAAMLAHPQPQQADDGSDWGMML